MSGATDQTKTPSLSTAQRLAWLRLIRSENVGPHTFRDLVNHFGSAETALDALPDLSKKGGKTRIRVCPVSEAEAELDAHDRFGARLVAMGEPDYPSHLRHVDGPPPLLSVVGGDVLRLPKTIAIVGARNASLSGRKLAGQISQDLGSEGFVIVSGLARGIDAAAHEAALASGTVAAFAGGIDVLYPPEHGQLLAQILKMGGNAISEMPIGWKPRGRDFPRRNRLISGMALGVVIIEAAKGSGSLHTARFALEQNREIFAVPGSPLDPRSEGANTLIRQGAMLIRHAGDVLEALSGRIAPELPFDQTFQSGASSDGYEASEPTDKAREKIISALGPTPVELDELIRFSEEPARVVHIILLELELAGRLERHRGQRVSLLY
ncbi:DNA processing protein [Roseibium hamelinense]|uniref:DNA processing protein n=1 Tax=Roseibium hamelinense TaxID=150831 RepID=A0A562SGB4_9HYPH|nr:DNA-processing protein DprA [Roseibium hamelinense]MTI44222.1 DNA-protecting protein DprA [Roseibium hamelinense]TWI79994.1 DNA processing protein [Roseibium hamelinense]